MSVLFNHACRYEFFDRNPIHLVRQGAKRHTAPTIVMPAEIKALSNGLALFGLKWGNIDFAQGTMASHAPSCNGVVGPCKTESSQKPVPMHPTLADALMQWRKHCTYIKPEDWVFASERYRGRRPYWGQAILRKYIRPAAQRAGIQKRFGWHTFRHTYSTLLRSVGTEFKVMQELLRHSSFRSTPDVYTQAVTPAKHAAQAAVISLVFSSDEDGPALVAG
jgi:site-specific recombinase XerD